jgi:hypothetical protein
MELKFGTLCRSGGEDLGVLWGLCVEPRERLLLRAVVEKPQAEPLQRAKVPFGNIDRADSDQVVLGMSSAELARMPLVETVTTEEGRKPRRRRRGDEVLERLLTATTPVYCRDGEAGPLRSITVDARSGDLEEISFEVGATTPRIVTLPLRDVEDFEEGRITLKIDRDDLAQLTDRRS